LVSESGQTLERIVTSVKKVSDIIAELAAGSQEQLSGIEQVNRAVTQLDQMTQQNAALVEEASAASKNMASRSQAMSDMLDRYKLGDEQSSRAMAAITRQVA
jgi:methyl-accepting chemotaxis protein